MQILIKKNFKSSDKFNEFIEPKLSVEKRVTIKDNITIIKDGKFTSCKSTNNETEGCPYWNLKAGLTYT